MQSPQKDRQYVPVDPQYVPGWGIDADPQNDPTYPMKPHRTDLEQQGYNWERPTLQPVDVEVLHSNERPDVTAVFGTASPPSGLSGMIRRWAFRWSENEYNHWLPLILADRVNVVEGVIEDIAHGKFPNIWKEKGYNASWKHDRLSLITRLATFTAISAGLVLWLSSGSSKKKGKGKAKREKSAGRRSTYGTSGSTTYPTGYQGRAGSSSYSASAYGSRSADEDQTGYYSGLGADYPSPSGGHGADDDV